MKPTKMQIVLWLTGCFLSLATAIPKDWGILSAIGPALEKQATEMPQPNASGYGNTFHFTEITLLILIASVILLSVVILLTRKNFDEELKRFSDSDTRS